MAIPTTGEKILYECFGSEQWVSMPEHLHISKCRCAADPNTGIKYPDNLEVPIECWWCGRYYLIPVSQEDLICPHCGGHNN